MSSWFARLRHDLVKRLCWPARDRRDMGGQPAPGELEPRLFDEIGEPTTVESLWASLREDAPPGLDLSAFEAALGRAEAAARAGDVDGVLALEAHYDVLVAEAERLASGLKGR